MTYAEIGPYVDAVALVVALVCAFLLGVLARTEP